MSTLERRDTLKEIQLLLTDTLQGELCRVSPGARKIVFNVYEEVLKRTVATEVAMQRKNVRAK